MSIPGFRCFKAVWVFDFLAVTKSRDRGFSADRAVGRPDELLTDLGLLFLRKHGACFQEGLLGKVVDCRDRLEAITW